MTNGNPVTCKDVGNADLVWNIDRPTYTDVGNADLVWNIDRPTYKDVGNTESCRNAIGAGHFGQFRRPYGSAAAFLRRIGLLVLIALASTMLGSAAAQQTSTALPSYDVELVIFRHLSSNATDETWGMESSTGEQVTIPDEDASPFESNTPPSSATATQSFPPLPPAKFKLTAIQDTLRRSRNYQPLAHIGWTQPGFGRDAAPFISVNSFVPASSGLTGQIALSRGRYLHLTLDLTYTGPDSQTYVLRQSRRMRSNEQHYIDHPKFGVIAVVMPSSP